MKPGKGLVARGQGCWVLWHAKCEPPAPEPVPAAVRTPYADD